VRRPTPRRSSSYSRLTARVAWRRALQRQGVAAGLGRSLLILNVYAGVRQMSREAADKTQPCVGRNRDRARGGHLTSARIAVPPICSGHIDICRHANVRCARRSATPRSIRPKHATPLGIWLTEFLRLWVLITNPSVSKIQIADRWVIC